MMFPKKVFIIPKLNKNSEGDLINPSVVRSSAMPEHELLLQAEKIPRYLQNKQLIIKTLIEMKGG